MNTEVLLALLGSTLFAGLGVIFKQFFTDLYKGWKEKKSKKALRSVIRDRIEIDGVLYRALAETGAFRIIVVQTHNGGGKPSTKRSIYFSVLYEAIKIPIAPIKERIQNQLADIHYEKLIHTLIEKDEHEGTTEEFSSGGDLRDIHEVTKTTYIKSVLFFSDDKSIYHIGLNWNDREEIGAQENEGIRLMVNTLRRKFK